MSELVLASDIAELQRLLAHIEQFGKAHALSTEATGALQLALEEVVTNVIVHGYRRVVGHTVRVRLTCANNTVTAEVEDDAPAFDPLARPQPAHVDHPVEDRPIGGLGIHLVKKLMDAVEYQRNHDRNLLILRKHC
jgi:anti-sigma regulatory factor (Ser/Thr protein kinase)